MIAGAAVGMTVKFNANDLNRINISHKTVQDIFLVWTNIVLISIEKDILGKEIKGIANFLSAGVKSKKRKEENGQEKSHNKRLCESTLDLGTKHLSNHY